MIIIFNQSTRCFNSEKLLLEFIIYIYNLSLKIMILILNIVVGILCLIIWIWKKLFEFEI
jgi:hypothetical protein